MVLGINLHCLIRLPRQARKNGESKRHLIEFIASFQLPHVSNGEIYHVSPWQIPHAPNSNPFKWPIFHLASQNQKVRARHFSPMILSSPHQTS